MPVSTEQKTPGKYLGSVPFCTLILGEYNSPVHGLAAWGGVLAAGLWGRAGSVLLDGRPPARGILCRLGKDQDRITSDSWLLWGLWFAQGCFLLVVLFIRFSLFQHAGEFLPWLCRTAPLPG